MQKVLCAKSNSSFVKPLSSLPNKIAKFFISKDRGKNVRKKNEYLNLIKSSFKKFKIKYNTSKILDEIIDSVSLSSR